MAWFKRERLGPVDPEILEAHAEAKKVKEAAAKTAGVFHRLAVVMDEFHETNGVAEKLGVVYRGKGWL